MYVLLAMTLKVIKLYISLYQAKTDHPRVKKSPKIALTSHNNIQTDPIIKRLFSSFCYRVFGVVRDFGDFRDEIPDQVQDDNKNTSFLANKNAFC